MISVLPHLLLLLLGLEQVQNIALLASDDVIEKQLLGMITSHNRCEWKPRRLYSDRCSIDMQECFIPAVLPEGSGYFYFARYGSLVTIGGGVNVQCTDPLFHVSSPGSYLTRVLTASIEPVTGLPLSFPPIHFHHGDNDRHSLQLPIASNVLQQMPWLALGERRSWIASFLADRGSADIGCVHKGGAGDCLMTTLPLGYGEKCYYKQSSRAPFFFHIQDTRVAHSPPLASYIAVAHFYVTGNLSKVDADTTNKHSEDKQEEPQRQQQQQQHHQLLQPVLYIALTVSSVKGPQPYILDHNRAGFQFVTYYFSMNVTLIAPKMHAHSVVGDEAWIIRGTQDDLGIAQQQQRDVVHKGGQEAVYSPLYLSSSEELQMMKTRMRNALATAARNFESSRRSEFSNSSNNSNNNGSNSNSSSSSSESMNEHINEVQYLSTESGQLVPYIPFQQNSSLQRRNSKPDFLYEYFARVEVINSSDISAMQQQWERAFARSSTQRLPFHLQFHPDGEQQAFSSSSSSSSSSKLRVDQLKALCSGVQGGQYYRQMIKDRATEHVHIRAGDFITLVHFMEPRSAPTDTSLFDHTTTTIDQHTIFDSVAIIPDIPQFS